MYSGLTVSADRTGQPRKSLDFQDRSQLFPTAMALASVPVFSNNARATETVHKIDLPSSSTLPQDTTDKEDAVFRVRIPCQGMPAMSRHTWSLNAIVEELQGLRPKFPRPLRTRFFNETNSGRMEKLPTRISAEEPTSLRLGALRLES